MSAATPTTQTVQNGGLTEEQKECLDELRECHRVWKQARADLVDKALEAFQKLIPAHHIGRAMEMSEAGARKIRKTKR